MSLSSPTRRPPVPHCALCCALLPCMSLCLMPCHLTRVPGPSSGVTRLGSPASPRLVPVDAAACRAYRDPGARNHSQVLSPAGGRGQRRQRGVAASAAETGGQKQNQCWPPATQLRDAEAPGARDSACEDRPPTTTVAPGSASLGATQPSPAARPRPRANSLVRERDQGIEPVECRHRATKCPDLRA